MNVIFKMNCECFLKITDLFNILHPLGHLGVAHVVDILDEGVILLPERHLLAVGVLKEGTIKTILNLYCHFFHFGSPRYEEELEERMWTDLISKGGNNLSSRTSAGHWRRQWLGRGGKFDTEQCYGRPVQS